MALISAFQRVKYSLCNNYDLCCGVCCRLSKVSLNCLLWTKHSCQARASQSQLELVRDARDEFHKFCPNADLPPPACSGSGNCMQPITQLAQPTFSSTAMTSACPLFPTALTCIDGSLTTCDVTFTTDFTFSSLRDDFTSVCQDFQTASAQLSDCVEFESCMSQINFTDVTGSYTDPTSWCRLLTKVTACVSWSMKPCGLDLTQAPNHNIFQSLSNKLQLWMGRCPTVKLPVSQCMHIDTCISKFPQQTSDLSVTGFSAAVVSQYCTKTSEVITCLADRMVMCGIESTTKYTMPEVTVLYDQACPVFSVTANINTCDPLNRCLSTIKMPGSDSMGKYLDTNFWCSLVRDLTLCVQKTKDTCKVTYSLTATIDSINKKCAPDGLDAINDDDNSGTTRPVGKPIGVSAAVFVYVLVCVVWK
ncbi:uncharacterized protein LOC121386092 [Gigantopelta aegis]|uniref:uncharacterized protein LOC121386092 n=1 Tax=Gigantopelta aegis TaxID=1735272 RepID=UPI001B88B747|nr:uncharacterized protein LOC121386092 [Gigantopelta aegis]